MTCCSCQCLVYEEIPYFCGFTEADGPRFEAIQLVQNASDGDIGYEVVHLIILVGQPGLLGHYGLRRGEAVVHPPDALTVADCQACVLH